MLQLQVLAGDAFVQGPFTAEPAPSPRRCWVLQHKASLCLLPATPGPAQGHPTGGQWGWRKKEGAPSRWNDRHADPIAPTREAWSRKGQEGSGPGCPTDLSISQVGRSCSSHRTSALSVPSSPDLPCPLCTHNCTTFRTQLHLHRPSLATAAP